MAILGRWIFERTPKSMLERALIVACTTGQVRHLTLNGIAWEGCMGYIVHGVGMFWEHMLFLDHCCPYIFITVTSNNAFCLFFTAASLVNRLNDTFDVQFQLMPTTGTIIIVWKYFCWFWLVWKLFSSHIYFTKIFMTKKWITVYRIWGILGEIIPSTIHHQWHSLKQHHA